MGAQVISLLTVLIALGSVCFLAYIVTKFFGKKSAGMLKSKYMKVIDSLSMGFDKTVYLVQVGEQYILMYSSTKGFDFICNIEATMMNSIILNTPQEENKNAFGKYFDFFKVNQGKKELGNNEVNDNLQKLRNAFNNKK